MIRTKLLVVLLTVVTVGLLSADNDVTTGVIEESQMHQRVSVDLPADFNVEEAKADLREARLDGDQSRFQLLSSQLSTWWRENANQTFGPEEQGYNTNPGPQWDFEGEKPSNGNPPDWGTDVRMDPRDGVYNIKITSTSTGELYGICQWIDGSDTYCILLRSIDNGLTWTATWNNNFGSTYTLSDVGLYSANDTLVTWYVLHNPGASTHRTWVRVCEANATTTPIYWGSPTGDFNPVEYTDLHCCSDAPVWGTSEYVYATWTETYGAGPDSTRVMSAVSWENDVSAWETGPNRLRASNGANIYYTGTRTAFGSSSDMMWIVAWLHPLGYPTTYDRLVRGWYSDDYGSTWNTTPVDITPSDNGRDEYDCVIAGSHSNTNWVILATQVDTGSGADRDVNNWYSTDDGTTWTWDGWVSNSLENFLGDIWVDDNSTAFYGALRQNTATEELVKLKVGDITDPTSWTGSLTVNDVTSELSDVYGPSISYNLGNNDAIMAWNDYVGFDYSIWFDSESWATGIAERPGQELSPLSINLAPNPAKSSARLSYTVQTEGRVQVSLYDATGRLVDNLVNETKSAGNYSTTIESENIAAGIYFVRVETPDGVGTKTMTIIR